MPNKFLAAAAVLIPLSVPAQPRPAPIRYEAVGKCAMPPRSENNKDKAIKFSVNPEAFMDEGTFIGSMKIEERLKGIDYRMETRFGDGSGMIIVSIRPANPSDTLRIKTLLRTSELEPQFDDFTNMPGKGDAHYEICLAKSSEQARENAAAFAKASGSVLGKVSSVYNYYEPSSNEVVSKITYDLE